MNKTNENYNKAFNFMTEVGIEGVSKRLRQLLTFHTVFWISSSHKDGHYSTEDLILLDNIIGEELNKNLDGDTSNQEYDGGRTQYDIDFFTEKYIVPNRQGKQVRAEIPKPEWGQETIAVSKKEPEKIDNIKKDLLSVVSILDYANGTQITRMLNVKNPTMVKHKPYDKVPKEIAIEMLTSLLPVLTNERKRLAQKFLEKEGAI